ncbi:uncharacterized protein KY384_002888 [Bacidia gigantensis]|uniref:uncharacterized protein n=1 Tax=Bacidia gigantensis TaxID=2732470 RepID=UPI001D05839B|nr:uncharacterized protein KY384_002888 [Bacidia gigantensis]KAG8532403.1 hypothetical protein KY384_002888 [Bacidia gigantensis]
MLNQQDPHQVDDSWFLSPQETLQCLKASLHPHGFLAVASLAKDALSHPEKQAIYALGLLFPMQSSRVLAPEEVRKKEREAKALEGFLAEMRERVKDKAPDVKEGGEKDDRDRFTRSRLEQRPSEHEEPELEESEHEESEYEDSERETSGPGNRSQKKRKARSEPNLDEDDTSALHKKTKSTPSVTRKNNNVADLLADSSRPTTTRKQMGRPRKTPGRQRTSNANFNPYSKMWHSIRRLESLSLHPTVASLLEQPDFSPELLLEAKGEPVLSLMYAQNGGLNASATTSYVNLGEGIAAAFLYTTTSQSRDVYGRLRSLFLALFFGDYAEQAFGKGGHINKRKSREMVEGLMQGSAGGRLNGITENDMAEKMMEDIPKMVARGKVLDVLCERFGVGSLFWLQECLTENCLDRNAPTSGAYFDSAMKNLNDLHLSAQVKKSGADKVGNQVRAELARVFGGKGKGPAKTRKSGRGKKVVADSEDEDEYEEESTEEDDGEISNDDE